MSLKEKKKYVKDLSNKIRYHNYRYYVLDSPEITDYEYDMLLRELEKIEDEFPQLVKKDSPTKVVGGYPLNNFEKVMHKVQMGSLQDAFSKDEILAFDKRIREIIDNPFYIVEPKIDGLSVSLEYENSKFKRASTRGDGFVGEDVTINVSTIDTLPLKLDFHLDYIEIRCEVFMPKDIFKKISNNDSKQIFKNARNAAAGSLRQKDPNITKERCLKLCAFNIQQISTNHLTSHKQSLEFLSSLGFFVPPAYKRFNNIQDVISHLDYIASQREQFPFDIDGAVIKIDRLADRETIGGTSKFPKWAVAYKYPPDKKETILRDILINVGRTGVLTPTAVFDPIDLSGSTVSKAILHNQKIINEKDIRIGDKILVHKAGDIIPEIIKSIEHSPNSKKYEIPDICPVCSSDVIFDDVNKFCVNPECSATLIRNIIHFVSRDAMNIEGLGEKMIRKLIESDCISCSADIYFLKRDDFRQFYKDADKIISNIISAIEKSKSNDLSNLLFGLGIKNIGKRSAELICEKMSNIDDIMTANFDQFNEIEGFGNVMSENIVKYFSLSQTKRLIDKFKQAGINLTSKNKTKITSEKLKDLVFVITGTLTNYTREQMKQLIEENGGKVSSTISKNTSYLIAGEKAGSKLKKAENLGVKIIDESELLKFIS